MCKGNILLENSKHHHDILYVNRLFSIRFNADGSIRIDYNQGFLSYIYKKAGNTQGRKLLYN
ncbi:hypothetical protein [Prevotella pallens]|uniref:hypothetical protein n=1 Tax=Prevotella pallens TaxID=60133 RepID=UPI0023EF849D|nr:hypothetical protein [Prevotella pallens]